MSLQTTALHEYGHVNVGAALRCEILEVRIETRGCGTTVMVFPEDITPREQTLIRLAGFCAVELFYGPRSEEANEHFQKILRSPSGDFSQLSESEWDNIEALIQETQDIILRDNGEQLIRNVSDFLGVPLHDLL